MSYSANDNQNYFVADGRSTSRVLAQPGGQCSISIGGWTPEELGRQRQLKEQRAAAATLQASAATVKVEESPKKQSAAADVVVAPTGKENPVDANIKEEEPEAKSAVAKPPTAASAAPTGVSSNAFASASSTNSFNVITDRPTSRVTMPPGGHTSIRLW